MNTKIENDGCRKPTNRAQRGTEPRGQKHDDARTTNHYHVKTNEGVVLHVGILGPGSDRHLQQESKPPMKNSVKANQDKDVEKGFKDAFETLKLVIGRYSTETFFNRSSRLFAWRNPASHALRGIAFYAYSPAAFRLSTAAINSVEPGIPRRLAPDKRFPAFYRSELSFAPSDLDAVACGFIRFTESAFEYWDIPERIWRWPLFARPSQTSFPHYAWSAIGQRAQRAREAARRAAAENDVTGSLL
jgi:hypothetical protein